MNLEDQYDRIYRFLYFHLHDKHEAEDLTQEAFLRFLGSRTYQDENRQLQYLYTIKDDNIQFGRNGGKFHPVRSEE